MSLTEESPISLGDQNMTSFADTPTFCLFKDVHKGIRNEMFGLTFAAGAVDPNDAAACAAVADRVHGLYVMLEDHAHHEDLGILPALDKHLPDLAQRMTSDHDRLDKQLDLVVELGKTFGAATSMAERRRLVHRLYLDTANFTAHYLQHQNMEERTLMPALEQAVGFDEVLRMHQAIVSSVAPDVMARFLALMLPAMNLEDRVEMLGPMLAEVPPEIGQGVIGLAGTVLSPVDYEVLLKRLELA